MGFPRILSKNNKIYTKLGDFCLSGDGNHFWIVCFLCQQELQSQDNFWKHIQDEHNFVSDIKHEHHRNAHVIEETTTIMPMPLYRKVEEEQHHHVAEHEEQEEPKDYTEMRVIEPNAVEVNIKMEPQGGNLTTAAQQAQQQAQNSNSGIYQLSTGSGTAYAAIVHTPTTLPAITMSVAQPQTLTTTLMTQQDLPKETIMPVANNTSSAVSSEDGERWYVCDYETCGLKFKYQSRLELHRSVHSKVRRFACELCGASFKQSCNLSTHRKKKHDIKGTKGTPVVMQQHRF